MYTLFYFSRKPIYFKNIYKSLNFLIKMLDILSEDILLYIKKFLYPMDVVSLRLCSKYFKNLWIIIITKITRRKDKLLKI